LLLINGQVWAVIYFSVALLPALFWRVRSAPIVILVATTALFDSFGSQVPEVFTGKLPLFRSLSESYGASGAIYFPIEILLGLVLIVWLARAIAEREARFRPSHLGVAVAVFFAVALAAELHGIAAGAIFNISLWEIRPFLYLAVTYFLASRLVDRHAALEAILWGMVIATGVKGILGTERVIALSNVNPRPESLLEHDESVFFSCFIVLTVALWVFRKRGYLRRVATALLPWVFVADLGNNRRAAWVILPAMLLALAIVIYVRIPERRKMTAAVVAGALILGYGYTLAFRNSTALFAQPAHAIWSEFQPDARDASSNIYRQIENVNLGIDIRNVPLVGTGFGVPIPHPIPVFDASNIDPLINFIPHNNILYVWLRMGSIGALSFWFLIGASMVAACRLARHEDSELALFGAVVLVAVIAWLGQGWLDKGIASFRIAILIGCLLGALQAAAWRLAPTSGHQPISAQRRRVGGASVATALPGAQFAPKDPPTPPLPNYFPRKNR
jgi:hypothetical protein